MCPQYRGWKFCPHCFCAWPGAESFGPRCEEAQYVLAEIDDDKYEKIWTCNGKLDIRNYWVGWYCFSPLTVYACPVCEAKKEDLTTMSTVRGTIAAGFQGIFGKKKEEKKVEITLASLEPPAFLVARSD